MAKIRLVLADKSEIFREGLAKLIEHDPDVEVVCTCCAGSEAVESAYEHQPDVILLGSRLSECSGIEVAQRIHEGLPETNIVVLVHSEADEDLVPIAKAGVKAYLSEDISIGDLIFVIGFVAEGGVVVSPPVAARLLAEFDSLQKDKGAAKLVTLLSKREKETLSLVAQGLTNKEIATTLVISENTVKVHLRNIMDKLHASTRQQAVSLVGGKDLLSSVTQSDTEQV